MRANTVLLILIFILLIVIVLLVSCSQTTNVYGLKSSPKLEKSVKHLEKSDKLMRGWMKDYRPNEYYKNILDKINSAKQEIDMLNKELGVKHD